MAARRPIVLAGGVLKELPTTDSLVGVIDDSANDATHSWSAQKIAAAFAAVSGSQGSGSALNGVVSGCGILYTGALTFELSPGSYYIQGTLLSAAGQTQTLAAADPTQQRIDVLYLNAAGAFAVLTGTPSATPSQPAIDPTTQLYLTFVIVPAAATTLGSISTTAIYSEGTEWTGTAVGSGFTIGSTNNPYAGTKCVEGTTVAAAAYAKFVTGSPFSFDGDGNLVFRIRSKATWTGKRGLTIGWYRSGVAKGTALTLLSGVYGFDSSLTSAYQLVVIPKSAFQVPAGTTIDEIRFVDVGGSIGFYIDEISLQNTGTTTSGGTTSSGLTQTDGDARYARRSLNLSDVADAPTARTNLGLGTAATLASDTDTALAANSDTKLATQKAVKAYVDAAVVGLLDYKGATDCSANPNYPAASKGDSYVVSVAGKIGGASGKTVEAGDFYFAKADNAGGTDASVGASWDILQFNLLGALVAGNNLSDVASIIAAIDNLFTKGGDIASASTTNLASATGNFVDVTGTTTIAALGTAAAGVERTVRFTGALTLTYNATSLILPTAANIATAAGDVARFRSLGSGNWICVAFERASGQALVAAPPNIQSVASSATVTPVFGNDQVNITAQAAGLTLANPTGTAVDGFGMAIRIKDNGTARAITFGTQYRAIGVTLPTTTVISKTLYLGCIWNAADTTFDVVAVAQQA